MQAFSNLKNRAINEMLEMNERAAKIGGSKAEKGESVKQNANKIRIEKGGLSFSNDELLVLSLILILSKDSRDYWLFLALLYILM
jgi:hypothetical protein